MTSTLTKFLTDELGLTAEQVAALEPNAAILDAAEARVTQFAQRQDAVATAQRTLDEANDRLNREMTEWTTRMANDQPISAKLQRDLEAAESRAAVALTRLRTVAERAGLNPDEVAPMPTNTPPVVTPPAPDLNGYARTTEIQQSLGNMGNYLLDASATLAVIQHEHSTLFPGQFLDPAPMLNEMRKRAADKHNTKSLDLRAIWEEQNAVPARRETLATEKHNADMTAAEQRGYEKARSESMIPGGQPIGGGSHSPVLTRESANSPKVQRPGAPNRISQAASALASHKYRPQMPNSRAS